MPNFAIATADEAAKLATPRASNGSAVDLTPYTAAVNLLRDAMLPDGKYSQWGKLTLDAADKPRAERRRLFAAAKPLGVRIGYAPKDKNNGALWFRIRPEPKARAKKGETNGSVTKSTAAPKANGK